MNRLLRLKFLVFTTLCCVICLSVSAQNNSNMVRTYKMAYYDVDDDCYKDTTFHVYVLTSKMKKVIQYNIDIYDTKSDRSRAQLTDRTRDSFYRTGQVTYKPTGMTFETLISRLKNVREKFAEWTSTAKKNGIRDFTKELDEHDYSFLFGITFVQNGTTYFGKTPMTLTASFRVTDTGDCLMEIKPKHNCVICKPIKDKDYIALTEFGMLRFSSPEQIDSLIDALTHF